LETVLTSAGDTIVYSHPGCALRVISFRRAAILSDYRNEVNRTQVKTILRISDQFDRACFQRREDCVNFGVGNNIASASPTQTHIYSALHFDYVVRAGGLKIISTPSFQSYLAPLYVLPLIAMGQF